MGTNFSQIPKAQKIYGPQIANPQLLHLRKVRKSIKKLSLQICGFAIFGTYLLTAHLCSQVKLNVADALKVPAVSRTVDDL